MAKIGILTQPLHNNYGGLLQAYALKESLQQMGHSVVIIDRRHPKERFPLLYKVAILAQSIATLKRARPNLFLPCRHYNIINRHTIEFQKEYIPNLSKMIVCNRAMRRLKSEGFHAFIVGSDQCWRPRYSPHLPNYFLDFAQGWSVKRISYAASFGTDRWEFSKSESAMAIELIKEFDMVSVRERQGVELVRDFLKREDAVEQIDPTMLLEREHYLKLIEEWGTKVHKEERANLKRSIKKEHPHLHHYILDNSREKEQLVERLAQFLKLHPLSLLPTRSLYHTKVRENNIQKFSYRSPIEWLQATATAQFVVTDSFHGTLFALLFNIPFIALVNRTRGLSRIESLLTKFNLMERLVEVAPGKGLSATIALVEQLAQRPIEWEKINQTVAQERKKGIDFLKQV
ncbi:MAG: polysaccharide pyruvyl transferase family protein [Bacteroidales bacterium]